MELIPKRNFLEMVLLVLLFFLFYVQEISASTATSTTTISSASTSLNDFNSIPQTACGSNISVNSTLRLPVDDIRLNATNFTCSWNLKTNGRSLIISFVEYFANDSSEDDGFSGFSGCYDFVSVNRQPSNQQINENLCGLPDDIVVSPGSHTGVKISFAGDNADLHARFSVSVSFYGATTTEPTTTTEPATTTTMTTEPTNSIDFYSIPQTQCGSEISANSTLRLPVASNGLYVNNFDCNWNLITNGRSLIISFVGRFAIESSRSNCPYDFVNVFLMPSNAPVGDKLCGFSFPNNVVIPSGSHTGVKISFESDGSIVYAGFAVSVSFDVDTGNATLPDSIDFYSIPQTQCGSEISANSTLRLPVASNGLYVNNFDCNWNLETNGRSLIISFVGRFEVEPSGSTCRYDFVTVYLLPFDEPLTNKLCGFSLPDKVVIPSGSHTGVKISFESDYSIVYGGFAVSVSFDVDTGNVTLPDFCVRSSDCPENERCNSNTRTCQCPERYRLTADGLCIVDQSPCTSNYCRNGGACFVNNNLILVCNCTSSFVGRYCEYFVSPCRSNPCINGLCEDYQGDFTCNCFTGYDGKTCNEDINECLDMSQCGPNAICTNTLGSFTCSCVDGFSFNDQQVCVENTLLRFGPEVNDLTVPSHYFSEVYELVQINIPFGTRSFSSFHVYQSGIILLGNSNERANTLTRPFIGNALRRGLGILSCFWDNLAPIPGSGGVFYQAYNTLDGPLNGLRKQNFDKAADRVRTKFSLTDFNPVFVFIATWSEVSMFPLYPFSFLEAPSTFQAVIVSDGCDTYLMYLYQPNGMLWDTRLRLFNNALIGYSNGFDEQFLEIQNFYRPDKRMQRIGGVTEGRYFYKLTPTRTAVQEVQCNCFQWYRNDLQLPPVPVDIPCPNSFFSALFDFRFSRVADFWFGIINRYNLNRYYRSTDTSIWSGNSEPSRNCFQPFFGTGPRCCYLLSPRRTFFEILFFGRLVSGSRASHYERYQIPILNQRLVYYRNQEVFDQEVSLTRDQDLIPRDQCCIRSNSQRYCRLYQSRRPSATSFGYDPPRISFFFGDPHITTLDGVAYTFNGLGEFFLIYAPGVLSLQGRTRRALNERNVQTEATVFSRIAGRDYTSESGLVEFLVNPNNASLVTVMVDGVIEGNLSDIARMANGISLTVENNEVRALFPSQTSIDVKAENNVLTFQLSANRGTLFDVAQGLLGAWTGNREDDFQLRNGTLLNYTLLQNTKHPEILNGTLSESLIYPFGLSWRITMEESLFNYTAENVTYETYNPSNVNEPPFLEILVEQQINSSLFESNVNFCTPNETKVLSTTCLYDLLTTNRTELALSTLEESNIAAETEASLNNNPPNISLPMDNEFIVNGTLQAQLGFAVNITLSAMDSDGDQLTFSITNDSSAEPPQGVVIDSNSGVLSWTPTDENRNLTSNLTLNVQVDDGKGGISAIDIPIALCVCANNQTCLYDITVSSVLNYEIVGCDCSAAYSGPECSEDVNACDLSFCFPNVTCTDRPAPESGADCGPCPDGTEGNGINCTNINFCDSDPCEQNCTSLFNNFTCSCMEGYELTSRTMCMDINECSNNSICSSVPNSYCVNLVGNFSCQCNDGFFKGNNGQCLNIDECANSNNTCNLNISSCVDTVGSFVCACNEGYNDTTPTTCDDVDECLSPTTCDTTTERCINTVGSFQCVCSDGYMMVGQMCEDVNECLNETLNDCGRNNVTLCTNTDGSFQCTCLNGYTLNGTVCIDFNECIENSTCPSNSTCVNRVGTFECVCDPGFRDVDRSCEYIATTTEPVTTTTEPSAATTEPLATTTEPSNATTERLTTTTEPSNETTERLTTTTEPSNETTERLTTTTEPSNATTERLTTTTEPSNATIESLATTTELSNATTKPLATTTELSTPFDFCASGPCHVNSTCFSNVSGPSCECNEPLVGDGIRCEKQFFLTINLNIVITFQERRINFEIPIRFGNNFYKYIVAKQNGVVEFTNDLSKDLPFNNPVPSLSYRLLCPFWLFCSDCQVFSRVFFTTEEITSSLSSITNLEVLQEEKSDLYLPNPLIAVVFEWRSPMRRFQCIILSTYVKTVVFYIYDLSNFEYTASLSVKPFIGYIHSEEIFSELVNFQTFPFSSNIGTVSLYGFLVSSSQETARSRCISWFNRQPDITLPSNRLCPTTFRRNFFFRTIPRVYDVPESKLSPIRFPGDICYQQRRQTEGPICCYRQFFRRFGFFRFFRRFVLFSRLLFSSHYQSNQINRFSSSSSTQVVNQFIAYHQNEYQPFLDCEEANLLGLFYRKRPRVLLRRGRRLAITILFGDPHIETFSGAKYTFNGLGEYYLIYTPGELIAQARFVRAIRENGTESDATITSAMVVSNDNTQEKVQFEAGTENETLVYINSAQVQFPNVTGEELSVGNISYSLTDDGEFEVVFGTNYSVTVSTLFGVLKYSFGIDLDLQSRARGLMGPFILPNGTQLTDSELLNTNRNDALKNTYNQEKMFRYGQNWAVPESETKFDYAPNTNWSSFNPSGFTPAFIEDLFDSRSSSEITDALTMCSDRIPCVYDLFLTNNLALAEETAVDSAIFSAEQSSLNNSIPEITFTTPYADNVLRLMVGNLTTQLFTATDADNDTLLFSVSNVTGISINQDTGLLTASVSRALLDQVRNSNATTPELSVSANDSVALGSVLVTVRLCDCSARGECAWNLSTQFGTPQFGVVPCFCSTGFDGPYCDQTIDFCAGAACFGNCSSNSTGFTCDSCPGGTTGDGITCFDLNECTESTHSCNTTTTRCVNSFGNFSCSCLNGYIKPDNAGPMDPCVDIDECNNTIPACPAGQLCSNTMGNFVCNCPFNLTTGQSCNSSLFMTVVLRSGSVDSTELIQFFLNILARYFPSRTARIAIISMTNESSNSVKFEFAVDLPESLLDIFAALRDGSVLDASGFVFDTSPRPIHQNITQICTGPILQPSNVPTSATSSEFEAETVCGSNALYFKLNACDISRFGIDPLRLVLGPVNQGGNNQACTSVLVNGVNGTLNVVLLHGFREPCGITIQTTNDTIIYNFTVTSNDIDANVIQRKHVLKFFGSCSYNRVTNLLSSAVNPSLRSEILPEVVQPGTISFTVQACTNSICSSTISQVILPNPIYYSITLPSRFATTTILKAESCWATNMSDPNSPLRYDLITNECPAPNDGRVQIEINNQNQTVLFRVSSFVWTANSSFDIYVHCMVSLCSSSAGNCSGVTCSRKRRSAPVIKKQIHLISLPPVEVVSPCDESNACEHSCKLISNTPTCFCRPGYYLAVDQTSCLLESEPVQGEYKIMSQETSSHSTSTVLSILVTSIAFLLTIIMILKLIRSRK